MSARRNRRGAKPLPKGEAKSRVLLVRLRPADYAALVAAAAPSRVSAWARAELLAAAAERATGPAG